jgi:hypothetical protein
MMHFSYAYMRLLALLPPGNPLRIRNPPTPPFTKNDAPFLEHFLSTVLAFTVVFLEQFFFVLACNLLQEYKV